MKTKDGRGLGLNGDLAVIGAGNFDYGADGDYDNGAFYVFRRNAASGAWDLEHMLHGEENTSLGAKIAVGGGRFVVSSIPDILHVYERDGSDTWVETATLIPMYEDAPDDWIGVRLGDDRIVVWGSHIHVWDFVDGEWISSMVDPDLVSGPVWSTSSLSLEGDRIALGKESHVQILEQDETGEWVPAAELWPSGPAPGQFGYSVALRGNRLLAGDPWADGNTGAGVIFFTPDGGETWLEETRLLSIAAEMGGEVGSAVALGEDFAILGAPGAATGPTADCRPDNGTNCVADGDAHRVLSNPPIQQRVPRWSRSYLRTALQAIRVLPQPRKGQSSIRKAARTRSAPAPRHHSLQPRD